MPRLNLWAWLVQHHQTDSSSGKNKACKEKKESELSDRSQDQRRAALTYCQCSAPNKGTRRADDGRFMVNEFDESCLIGVDSLLSKFRSSTTVNSKTPLQFEFAVRMKQNFLLPSACTHPYPTSLRLHLEFYQCVFYATFTPASATRV